MKLKIHLLIIIFCCISSCELLPDHVYGIKIQNYSNDTIVFYANYSYPDTAIIADRPGLVMAYPQDYSYWDSKKKWEDVLPNDTISIFIFSKASINKFSWNDIKKNYIVLQRYDISIKELKALGSTFTYPPTGNMKNIKMYPSYKEK